MDLRPRRTILGLALLCGPALSFLDGRGTLAAEISGKVVEGDQPIPGALVRVRATTNVTISDEYGQFTLRDVLGADPVTVTAWKELFMINGSSAMPGDQDVVISLTKYQHR